MKPFPRMLLAGLVAGSVQVGTLAMAFAETTILNVSYDPTREFYKEFNAAFAKHWKAETGETVTVQHSHGGSGKQARAVIDGLEADVVTLALAERHRRHRREVEEDHPRLAHAPAKQFGALHLDDRLPGPQGQPQGHQGLGRPDQGRLAGDHPESQDLRRRPLELPRRLGLGQGQRRRRGQDQGVRRRIYNHVPVLDTGARGSTVTFAERGMGDVLLAWENEAYLALDEFGADQFEIVIPPQSILAEPPVAVVDTNVDAKGTRKVAEAYLKYLYSPEGQRIAAKNHYRPSKPERRRPSELQKLPELKLVVHRRPIFGGWAKAQPYHFGDGGIFDQIYKPAQ